MHDASRSQAEHLGVRFYPYPLVYAIGGHVRRSVESLGSEDRGWGLSFRWGRAKHELTYKG